MERTPISEPSIHTDAIGSAVRTAASGPHLPLALAAVLLLAGEAEGIDRTLAGPALEAAVAGVALAVAWRRRSALRLAPVLALGLGLQLAWLGVHVALVVHANADARVVYTSEGNAVALALGAPTLPGTSLFRDGSLTTRALRSSGVAWHGGAVTASTGERLTVYVSDSYDADQNDVQKWADFLAGLIHGSELSLLSAYIATPDEVASLCSSAEAVGCYDADRLVAVGEVADGLSPQEVVRHEYGHHVAAHRLNPPWAAADWGPKRWASQANVCARAAAGTAFPGDEGAHYVLNPGEAFAETYRALNDVRSFGAAIDWQLVDESFLPNTVELDAVEQDVRNPWGGPTTSVVHGRFDSAGRSSWSLPLRTPLDGSVSVSLSFSAGGRDHVVLMDGAGRQLVARGAGSGPRSEQLTAVICAQRSTRFVVTRQAGSGGFSLHITRP